VRELN